MSDDKKSRLDRGTDSRVMKDLPEGVEPTFSFLRGGRRFGRSSALDRIMQIASEQHKIRVKRIKQHYDTVGWPSDETLLGMVSIAVAPEKVHTTYLEPQGVGYQHSFNIHVTDRYGNCRYSVPREAYEQYVLNKDVNLTGQLYDQLLVDRDDWLRRKLKEVQGQGDNSRDYFNDWITPRHDTPRFNMVVVDSLETLDKLSTHLGLGTCLDLEPIQLEFEEQSRGKEYPEIHKLALFTEFLTSRRSVLTETTTYYALVPPSKLLELQERKGHPRKRASFAKPSSWPEAATFITDNVAYITEKSVAVIRSKDNWLRELIQLNIDVMG